MRKYDESLLQIGDTVKTLGITRKILLNYENLGLITPAVKDEDSGYRYYSADNLMQLGLIRSLQELGLSLREIADYLNGKADIARYLQRLTELRAALNRSIETLQIRAAQSGDFAVRHVALPRQTCFCRPYPCANTGDAARCLRESYLTAARRGLAPASTGLFTLRSGEPAADGETLCCIPVAAAFDGPEHAEFPAMPAVCIYYRGAYDGLDRAVQTLLVYAEERRLELVGTVRCIYLEGPSVRGANTDSYITQVAVPFVDRRRTDRRRGNT